MLREKKKCRGKLRDVLGERRPLVLFFSDDETSRCEPWKVRRRRMNSDGSGTYNDGERVAAGRYFEGILSRPCSEAKSTPMGGFMRPCFPRFLHGVR